VAREDADEKTLGRCDDGFLEASLTQPLDELPRVDAWPDRAGAGFHHLLDRRVRVRPFERAPAQAPEDDAAVVHDHTEAIPVAVKHRAGLSDPLCQTTDGWIGVNQLAGVRHRSGLPSRGSACPSQSGLPPT